MKENKITVLVEKVNYDKFRELRKENIYPLIVETNFLDIFESKEYLKDGNLYKLKIQYLKSHCWKRTCKNKGFNYEKDVLAYNDGTKFNILTPVEAFERQDKQEGIIVSNDLGESFISMEELYDKALGMKKEIQEDDKEKATIYKEVADFRTYQIMKSNSVLPLVVVLTDFESQVVKFPFDGIYIKTNLDYDKRIVLTLDLRILKKLISESKIELEGIKLDDGVVYKIDSMFGGDYDSFGTFTIGDKKEEILTLSKKLLEPKEFKTSNLQTEIKDYPYIY